MDQQAGLFKDDILRGVSLSVKNLQHQNADSIALHPKKVFEITKHNPHFRNLLNYLDMAFSFGLKDSKKGYWPLVKKVVHSSVLEIIEKHPVVSTELHKGYIWLYLTFVENSMDSYLRMILVEKKQVKNFYKNFSILRDDERCEILLNLVAGVEALTFAIDIKDPYLDYGHDTVLREEKVIIRVQPQKTPPQQTSTKREPKQPDITLLEGGRRRSGKYPDLVTEHSRSLGSDVSEPADDLVTHIHKKTKKKKTRESFSKNLPEVLPPSSSLPDKVLKGTIPKQGSSSSTPSRQSPANQSPSTRSPANQSPVVSPSNSQSTLTSPSSGILKTQDPMMKSFSTGDFEYREFLATYDETAETKTEKDIAEIEKAVFSISDNIDGTSNDMVRLKLEDNTESNQPGRLSPQPPSNSIYHHYEENDDDYELYRADSFDRFCRRGSPDSPDPDRDQEIGDDIESRGSGNRSSRSMSVVTTDEQGQLAENDIEPSPLPVPPQISQESLLRNHSPMTKSISKTSIDKLNDARYDTKAGILLPTLPRRPNLDDATGLFEEVTIDQNTLVLISLDIFQQPTESFIKAFKVYVGHLSGCGAPFYLLISNFAIYLLKQRATVQTGFLNMLSVNIDSINKVQTGLNFQEIFIFHDQGCLRLSTGDEINSRAIISTIKATIKSSQGVASGDGNEPMASNTYNELDLVIQDWLICHTQVEEPEILHFSLVYFSSIASPDAKQKKKVVKAGEMLYRHSNFGLINYWERAFFALRGHYLYQYNAKRTDLKQKYDLSTQCGGCINSGREDNLNILKIIGVDGSSTILELAIADHDEADDWLMNICQAVADAKIREGGVIEEPGALIACGMVLTQNKIYLFNQDPRSGRLVLEDSCPVHDITQVCVDNQCRTFCALSIDHNLDSNSTDKTIWLIDFQSEYEVGKFEQRLFGCWQLLYQVPLQFVLLNDPKLKSTIHHVLNDKGKQHGEIGKEALYELISN